MTTEELYKLKLLSARSYNLCIDNDLNDLKSILSYYRKNKTFNHFRNCGRRSDQELIELCFKYSHDNEILETDILEEENAFEKQISNLTRTQRDIINNYIDINVNSLSIRSKNVLESFLEGNFKIRNFSEKILLNRFFNAGDIRNAGAKSIVEIEDFISSVRLFIQEINKMQSEKDVTALKNKFFIQKTFSLPWVPEEILESQSIFKLVDYLILQNLFFEKKQGIVLRKALKIYLNQPKMSNDEIAESIDITKERVRQIKKASLENFFDKFKIIANFEDDLLRKYNIDDSLNLIYIDEARIIPINELNKTNFSKEFISYLIFAYYYEKFELIGVLEDVLFPRFSASSTRHNWDNFFIIKKNITEEFNFIAFADDISLRRNERIEETYSFNFKSYLTHFLKDNNYDAIGSIFPIAEKIINCEFGLYLDLDDNIIFERTTLKQVPEYAVEALEILGKPSKLEDIYLHIERYHPEITKSQEALRGSLQRTSSVIYFGRSSTYGLKKWEHEKEGIKGGTIKGIILEYLENSPEPVHVNGILNLVHKYRDDTNAKSILNNLKLDPQKQFVIFNQSFVGLKSKTYNSNLTDLPKFLGKHIGAYIRKNDGVDREILAAYFSAQLTVSKKNINFIIQQLIEQKFIFINNQNKLTA